MGEPVVEDCVSLLPVALMINDVIMSESPNRLPGPRVLTVVDSVVTFRTVVPCEQQCEECANNRPPGLGC